MSDPLSRPADDRPGPSSGATAGSDREPKVDPAALVLAAWDRPTADGELPAWIHRPLAGFWLRGAALGEQGRALVDALRRHGLDAYGREPWIAVDLRDLDRHGWAGVLEGPPPRASEIGFELSEGGEPLEATLAALELGRRLVDVGVDLVLGPSLHLSFGPGGDESGTGAVDSFGPDPHGVARAAGLYLEGLQAAGLLVVPGDFPGIDPRSTASPTWSRAELERAVVPFVEAFARGVEAVRVADRPVEALDPEAPVHRSSDAVDGFLRRELAFPGLAVAELDLEGPQARPEHAADMVTAGIDLVAVPSPEAVPAVLQALDRAAGGVGGKGEAYLGRLARAALRCRQLRADWAREHAPRP